MYGFYYDRDNKEFVSIYKDKKETISIIDARNIMYKNPDAGVINLLDNKKAGYTVKVCLGYDNDFYLLAESVMGDVKIYYIDSADTVFARSKDGYEAVGIYLLDDVFTDLLYNSKNRTVAYLGKCGEVVKILAHLLKEEGIDEVNEEVHYDTKRSLLLENKSSIGYGVVGEYEIKVFKSGNVTFENNGTIEFATVTAGWLDDVEQHNSEIKKILGHFTIVLLYEKVLYLWHIGSTDEYELPVGKYILRSRMIADDTFYVVIWRGSCIIDRCTIILENNDINNLRWKIAQGG